METAHHTPRTAIYSRKYRGETKTETVTVAVDREGSKEVWIIRKDKSSLRVHRNRISEIVAEPDTSEHD